MPDRKVCELCRVGTHCKGVTTIGCECPCLALGRMQQATTRTASEWKEYEASLADTLLEMRKCERKTR